MYPFRIKTKPISVERNASRRFWTEQEIDGSCLISISRWTGKYLYCIDSHAHTHLMFVSIEIGSDRHWQEVEKHALRAGLFKHSYVSDYLL